MTVPTGDTEVSYTDPGSFEIAAIYNTLMYNPNEYTTIQERHQYYGVAAELTESSGSYWFTAARDTTSTGAVGAADIPNLWFLSDNADSFLRAANEHLFEHNLKLLGQFVLYSAEVKGAEGFTGRELDNRLVELEQQELENFINEYKTEYLKTHDLEEWEVMIQNINNNFNDANYLSTIQSLFVPASIQFFWKSFIEFMERMQISIF